MNRENALSQAWTDDKVSFGDLTVNRPSPHRINVLIRRRNKWVSDEPREQTDIEAIAEWLFVLSRTPEELTAMFRESLEAWEAILDGFLSTLSDDVLSGWQEYLTGVLESVTAGGVADASPGKPKRKERVHAS